MSAFTVNIEILTLRGDVRYQELKVTPPEGWSHASVINWVIATQLDERETLKSIKVTFGGCE